MSGGIRVRRVTDPLPVQRGPAPFPTFDELTTAWDNHAEAKTALQRAEARLEEAEYYSNHGYSPVRQDQRGILSPSYRQQLADMEQLGQVRVPVQRVPSVDIGNKHGYERNKTRKKVTICDNFDLGGPAQHLSPPRSERDRLPATRNLDPMSSSRISDNEQIQRLGGQLKSLSHTLKRSAYDSDRTRAPRNAYSDGLLGIDDETYEKATPKIDSLSPSSREILSRGSANMSVDNSTAIRVLNDLPSQNERGRVQRQYNYQEEYVPAYERLYGAPPGEKLNSRPVAYEENDVELRERVNGRQRVRTTRTFTSGGALDHMERLREKVEQQKAAVASRQTIEDRIRHEEADPVVLLDPDAKKDPLNAGVSVATGKNTVRKVAAAPAPPTYKGFSEVETRFQTADGKMVLTEDNLTRKTSRKDRSQNLVNVPDSHDRALKPSMALHQQNRFDHLPKSSRTIRKIHKASKPLDKRPKRPDRSKGVISTTAWREGQKTVLKILGPPPEKPKTTTETPAPHSPPTHDTDELPSDKPHEPFPAEKRTENLSPNAEFSEHSRKIEEEQNMKDSDEPRASPDLENLPSAAKNVLEDLHLDSSSSEDEKPDSESEMQRDSKKTSRNLKKKSSRPAMQNAEQVLPAERIRHYDADNVRRYMAKQKAERRRRLVEEKKDKKLAQERKQEQLKELSKKQKESIRMSQRNRQPPVGHLGDTFSKVSTEDNQNQINVLDQLPRHHPFRQDGKKIDITSSDKENKNIWSTSSSDSSTQFNVLSDAPHSLSDQTSPIQPDPAHRIPNDITSERSPRETSPIGVVVTQMSSTTLDGGGILVPQENEGQRSEISHPASVAQAPFAHQELVNQRPLPTGGSSAARSKADRIQALKATAAALQGKIDNEVKKLTGEGLPPAVTSPVGLDRWAYLAGTRMAAPSRTVHFSRDAVELPVGGDESTDFSTRYQRMVGSDLDHRVFTGFLPGTGSLTAQAQLRLDSSQKDQAATTIQAAYRGHSIRQKLDWRLPSGRSLVDAIKKRPFEGVHQVQVSGFDRTSPLNTRGVDRTSPLDYRGADIESLSEGSLSDSTADDKDYMPTFKSLPVKHSHVNRLPPSTSEEGRYRPEPPVLTRPTSLQDSGVSGWKESLADGLSVISIYTRKYQSSKRAILYGQLPKDSSPYPPKNSVVGYSYNDDFSGSPTLSPRSPRSPRSPKSKLDDDSYTSHFTGSNASSASKTKTKSKTRSSGSSMSSPKTSSYQKPSRSEVTDQTNSRKSQDNTLDMSPVESFASTGDDSTHRRPLPRTPSPKSPFSFPKNISDRRTSPSLLSPTTSLVSKTPSSPDSTLSSGSLPPSSLAGRSRAPSSRSPASSSKKSRSKSRTSSKTLSSGSLDTRTRCSVSSKSMATDGVQNGFESAEVAFVMDRTTRKESGRAQPQIGPETKSPITRKPPLPGQYSPAALSLKMATELNLLESLEHSVRQISDMEHTRHVSMAQQESVSLAKVLQARQRDHEREIQLLSLKARQEIENTNKELEIARQRAVEKASDAERVLAQVRRETSDAVSEQTRRFIETQAEAARVTAEAAKQMAEAQKTPSQPPVPNYDPGKLASDTATAATTAAVTVALEQQRLQQIEFLKEMKGAFVPSPSLANKRSPGVGRQRSYSSSERTNSVSSRTDTPTSPKDDYSEDFTESPKPNHSANSISSGTIPDASSLSLASDHDSRTAKRLKSPASESVRTVSGLPEAQGSSSLSVPTDSRLTPVKSGYSSPNRRSFDSIKTISDANGASVPRSPSIAEDVLSASDSRTKTPTSSSFTSSSTPERPNKDSTNKMSPTFDVRGFSFGLDESFTQLSAEMLRQQLRDEEVRAQQQGALFKLREKTLLDKAKVDLEWLERDKRRHRESGDVEAVQIIRRKQQVLVAKVHQEQAEMRRLRAAQKAATHERQLLLFQQQEILRMRKATEAVKDHMKDMSNISISSSIGGALTDDHGSALASPDLSPDLPEVLSMSDFADNSLAAKREDHGAGLGEKEGGARDGVTAAEKQAQVMLKLKKMQQPLSMKYLTKREQQLTKRRRNAEELLAWQRRLDEEESQIASMEREAMRRLDAGANKPRPLVPRPPLKALPPSGSAHEDSASPASDVISTEASIAKDEAKEEVEGRREDGGSIAEDISQGSSIPEEVAEPTQKISTPHPAPATDVSGDDTLQNTDSIPEEYANESFESADHTLTPTKSPLPPPRSTKRSTPSGLDSFRAPLSPRRRIMESESGSESEKSFSQTVSEIASDQSDIEGRVKALESELRKRKMEADKLRRQQKRMQREKLKAQEASLKKQLESYDKLIEKTKAELKSESESAAKMSPSVTVKPQIKQLRVSESQRLKDRSHARSLRQRTTSDSSREGGAELGPLRKQRSVSEGSLSSRSSLEDLERDPSFPGYGAVFPPPTTSCHIEDTVPRPPKSLSPSPPSKRESRRSSSSISEEIPRRTPSSTADDDSRRSSVGVQDIPRKQGPQSQQAEEAKDSSQASEVSEDISSAHSSVSGSPDVSVIESPRVDARKDTVPISQREKLPSDLGGSPETQIAGQSGASDVSEEVISEALSNSAKEGKVSAVAELRKRIQDGDVNTQKSAPSSVDVHSTDEVSQKSEKSHSSSARSPSRTHSERSGASYSEDFAESSVSIGLRNKESHSDTEDDISEQLSVASEPSEQSVPSRRMLAFGLSTDKDHERTDDDTSKIPPEVTISEGDIGKNHERPEIFRDEDGTPFALNDEEQLGASQDFTGYEIGDHVLVSGQNKGTLLFKGVTHFAPGVWGGVELDNQQGTNDGSLDGHVYFQCKPSHGIFVPADRLEHLTEDVKTEPEQKNKTSSQEIISDSLPKTSKFGRGNQVRDMGLRQKEHEDNSEDSLLSSLSSKSPSEPIKPLAQVLKSEATDDDSIMEDLSEPATDDAALAALINSAAAAVESFHEDDIDEIFPPAASEAQTPRGSPEPEVTSVPSKEQLVDAITDQLTTVVVTDSVKAIIKVAEQQSSEDGKSVDKASLRRTSTEKPSTSLLEMLVDNEVIKSPRGHNEKPVIPSDEDEEKDRITEIKKNVDSATQTLLKVAITEMIALRDRRTQGSKTENHRTLISPESPKSPSPDTPCASPFVRNTTPYTPESDSPVQHDDATLDDDIFINRVKIETNFDLRDQDDQLPVARPGSPVFGESSGFNPEALSERLEQMQQMGSDVFEGDLFGEQEWFDDDFNSMPKSKSIIQVPVRSQEPPVRTPPVPGTPEPSRLDLTRIIQEPFYAVPHNRKNVKSLVDKSVGVFHEKALLDQSTGSLSPPSEIMGDDTKGSDIESTSRRSYKRLIFNLVGEAYHDITSEQEPTEQLPWTKPKRRPRKYFFDRPPRELPDIAQVVEVRALFVVGLSGRPKPDSSMNRFGKKKKDHVDEILTLELREEEQEWVNYDDDELAVKMQLTEAIFDSLLMDTAMVLSRIQDRRKARMAPMEPEIEF